MKLSRILCSKGMKLPRIPQLYLFCTVKPMCHFNPTQAMVVENRAINMLLTTMIRIACGTDKPVASVTISYQISTFALRCSLPKNVLGVCQFARFSDAIAKPEEVEPTPCPPLWREWDQIAITPCIRLFVLFVVSMQAHFLINHTQSML